MVTFNLYHGQSRIVSTYEARPVGMKWRQFSPKKMLMFALGEGSTLRRVRLEVDKFGDVEVNDFAEITHLAILGWPVRNLVFSEVNCERKHDQSCFVNKVTGQIYRKRLHPVIHGEFVVNGKPYEGVHDVQCGNCITGYKHEELIFRRSDKPDDPLAIILPDEAVHLEPYRHIMHPVELAGVFHCWCEGVFSSG